MSGIRKLYRMVLLGLLLLLGIALTFIFLRNARPPGSFSNVIVTIWLGLVVRSLGVKIKTRGKPLAKKTLFVANHISWLDIIILGRLVPVHFLSKHEIKSIPLLGWLATRAGTLYINRGCTDSSSDASSEITASLNREHNSIVFAEATTTNGEVKKFHSRLMQSAIDARAMVQPVAIFYPLIKRETGETVINPACLFYGDIRPTESFDRIARAPRIDVEVYFLEPLDSTGKKRDVIAMHAHDQVVAAIEQIKSGNH